MSASARDAPSRCSTAELLSPRLTEQSTFKSLQSEICKLQDEKQKEIEMSSNTEWRDRLRRELEAEIERRVREALDTPPEERFRRNRELARLKAAAEREAELVRFRQTARMLAEQRNNASNKARFWLDERRRQQTKSDILRLDSSNLSSSFNHKARNNTYDRYPNRRSSSIDTEDTANVSTTKHVTFYDSDESSSHNVRRGKDAMRHFGDLSDIEKALLFKNFTKEGFREALRTGRMPDGSALQVLSNGKFQDQFGIVRDIHGPFWPKDFGPCHPTPQHRRLPYPQVEPLLCPFKNAGSEPAVTYDNQTTNFTGRWRGMQIVYDSEKCPRFYNPPPVAEDVCPSLIFESRFECGNLRQVRRIGMFEYELVLRTDLYTKRHTQWYYFKVLNAQPKVTYKFVICNLLKPSSLYNEGMKPLFYSEKVVIDRDLGWHRAGHHIRYSRNVTHLQSPLLLKEIAYYQLEWQMEFPYAEDICYLAHCYPYTYSDLRHDLTLLTTLEDHKHNFSEDILCESRAGNSCFCVTITDKTVPDDNKHGIVVTARVHPGEANSSWMMKGLLEYLTGPSTTAAALRRYFIFKVIPMLNPDGVIVGNYRTSLAARDLNRNYRHPRRETFPTIYHTKELLEKFSQERTVILYCDLHGHSRKPNVFMYGCDSQYRSVCPENINTLKLKTAPENFLNERLFPWIMSRKAPELFSYKGCRFNIRKCKEATGRVVMWRQFEINNSFTMEATFCGTSLTHSDSRHFNTKDLERMGETFGSSLWEYKKVKEDTTQQSKYVVDMTFDLVVDLLKEKGVDVDRHLLELEQKSSLKKQSGEIDVVQKLRTIFSSAKDKGSSCIEKLTNDLLHQGPSYLLDQLSLETIDDCANILKQLNILEFPDSDSSSDSDSESEPEMPLEDSVGQVKRKKKKSKKSRDERGKRHRDSLEDEDFSGMDVSGFNEKKKISKKESETKFKIPTNPKFVNKFRNRHNNGIPCFSEERLMERANKRIYLMHSKLENARTRAMQEHGIYSDQEWNGLPIIQPVFTCVTEQNFLEMKKGLANLDDIRYRIQHIMAEEEHADDKSMSENDTSEEISMPQENLAPLPLRKNALPIPSVPVGRKAPKYVHHPLGKISSSGGIITQTKPSTAVGVHIQSSPAMMEHTSDAIDSLMPHIESHSLQQQLGKNLLRSRPHKLPSLTNNITRLQ